MTLSKKQSPSKPDYSWADIDITALDAHHRLRRQEEHESRFQLVTISPKILFTLDGPPRSAKFRLPMKKRSTFPPCYIVEENAPSSSDDSYSSIKSRPRSVSVESEEDP